jgi:hypothetical protein
MRFDSLFLKYIGVTTLVYPYLVVLFNFFSVTYLHFGVLLVSFFLGGVGGTLLPIRGHILKRYAGVTAMCAGIVLITYPFAQHHATLFILQFLFGVTNGILRVTERELIHAGGGEINHRKVVRNQFLLMIIGAVIGGLVGYFFDIALVIVACGILLIGAGLGYTYHIRNHA